MRHTTVKRHIRKTKKGRTVVKKHPRKLKNKAAYVPMKRFFPESDDPYGMLNRVNYDLYQRENIREGVRQKRKVWLDKLESLPKEKPFIAPEEKIKKEIPELEIPELPKSKRGRGKGGAAPAPMPKSPPPPPPPATPKAEKVEPNKFVYEQPIFTEIAKEPTLDEQIAGLRKKKSELLKEVGRTPYGDKRLDLIQEMGNVDNEISKLKAGLQGEPKEPPKFNPKFAKEEPKTIRREVPLKMETQEEHEKKKVK